MSATNQSTPAPASANPAPAAAPAGATPPAAAAPAPAADWTSGFNDELKGFVQNKGFKDPAAVLDSYRNIEKLMGAPKEKLLRLPDNSDDAQAMSEIYSKLGRPGAPGDYKIAPKEGGNKEFAGWMENTFFEAGLSQKQTQVIVNKWNELQGNNAKASEEQFATQLKAQEQALQKEWGAAYEQKSIVAKRAVREFGVEPQVIDAMEKAMGFDKVMKFFDKVGSKLGEADFVTNSSGNSFAMTPEAARNKIKQLQSDTDFVRRLQNRDSGATNEWNRAHQMAYPDPAS